MKLAQPPTQQQRYLEAVEQTLGKLTPKEKTWVVVCYASDFEVEKAITLIALKRKQL